MEIQEASWLVNISARRSNIISMGFRGSLLVCYLENLVSVAWFGC